MSFRIRLLTGAIAGAVLLGSTPLAAQSAAREGFFIGFGFGGGGGEVTGDTEASGGTGWLTLGGTVSPRVRLAADFNAFVAETNEDASYGTSTFSVLYYPSASGNLFLKGGVGASHASFTGPGPDGNGIGFGTAFGAGYDLRVGRKISITPQLTFFGGRTGDVEDDDGNPIADDVKFGVATLSIGIVFH
jgi:hypothetical protein